MKKNSKGFTLIELLAVVVIIGILAVFSIPIITGMVDRSRNKVYVADAKKLIAQAEYKIRSSNSDIEKPDPSNCIAISLVYLDSDDFDSPPNGGKYLKENSFVIVKNKNGKLEYSAVLVEKMKRGGYKGVELSSSAVLQSSSALDRVKIFTKNELVNVEDDLTSTYINSKLGKNYIADNSAISAIYNYPSGLDDSSSTVVAEARPRIIKSTLTSTSNKEFNSLDATLTLKVTDGDTALENLKVYISFDTYGTGSPVSYGKSNVFTKDFDFSNKYKYDGSTITMYILVRDPDGNEDQKKIEYKLHTNTAPEIDKDNTTITNGTDASGSVTAQVRLSVVDDLDPVDKLSVCIAETVDNTKPSSCTNYKNFNNYFTDFDLNTYSMEYTFTNCDGGCKRDGSTHYLTFFVKDKDGAISSEIFPYTFSKNSNPSINKFEVKSVGDTFPYTGNKTVTVSVEVSDDSSNLSSLKFTLSDGINKKDYKGVSSNGNNIFEFTFADSYKYDGSSKKLNLIVDDGEGGSASKSVNYTLYKNNPPEIEYFSLDSTSDVCDNSYLCSTSDGGNLDANVDIQIKDDLDTSSANGNVRVCISQNPSDCNNINDLSHYVPYSDYANSVKSIRLTGEYDGSQKAVYAYAIDSYNEISNPVVYNYTLYKDKVPIIETFSVESKEEEFTDQGSLNIKYYIDAIDDLENRNDLKFELYLDKSDNSTPIVSGNLSDYLDKENELTLPGEYDGRTVLLTAVVLDKNGQLGSTNVYSYDYTIYKKGLPTIADIEINSAEVACKNEDACSNSDNNSLKVEYQITIDDIIESDAGSLLVCVSESENCTNYESITKYYDVANKKPIKNIFNFTPTNASKPYDGSTKKLYVYVKDPNYADQNSNTVSSNVEYTIYNNSAPVELGSLDVVSNSGNGLNIADVTVYTDISDDLDTNLSIKYCKFKGSESCTNYQSYEKVKTLNNSDFFGITKYEGQEYSIYAYVKDSYGAETKTSEVTYKLHQDEAPEVGSLEAVADAIYIDAGGNVTTNEDEIYTIRYQNFRIAFSAIDYLDSYYYCLSDNENTCTDYSSTSYDGNSNDIHVVNFPTLTEYNKMYYLFLKDTNSKITTTPVEFTTYYQCQYPNESTFKYEYVFDSNKKYFENKTQINNNQAISIDRCSGKCYHGNDNIFGYYDKKFSYIDKFDSTLTCNSNDDTPDEENTNGPLAYKAYCDFKDCFKKGNSYQRKAIGTARYDAEEPFISEVGGTTYTCNAYYNLYLSSYNQYDEYITLTPSPDRICAEAVDDHKYDYKSSDNDPYVRVNDGGE